MGLFDKKKKGDDDYDSPVEQVNLSARAAPAPAAPQPARAPLPGMPPAGASPPPPSPAPQANPLASAPAAPAPAPPPARARMPEPEPDVPNYGIDKAIELMRLLPADNVELVVQVVKKTLESLQIQVPSIIKDASRKQSDIEGRIDVLKKEIFELEAEISTRKTEINALETDHRETTSVKERLILAEKLTEERKGTSPGVPVATASAPPSASPAGVPAPVPQSSRSSSQYPAVTTPAAAAPRPTDPPPLAGGSPIKK